MKILPIVLTFFIINCQTHRYKINNQPAEFFENVEIKTKQNINANINKKDIKADLEESEFLDNYLSDNFKNVLSKGCCFEHTPNSYLSLEYTARSYKTKINHPSLILFALTFGIFPSFYEKETQVKLKLENKLTTEVIKEYNYNVKERILQSWFIYLHYLLFSDYDLRFTGFGDLKNDHVQSILVNAFERDYIIDMVNKNSYFSGKINLSTVKRNIAVLPFKVSNSNDSSLAISIRDKIETILVKKNYNIIEREKLSAILKEYKLVQQGITITNRLKFGELLNVESIIVGEIIDLNKRDKIKEFSIRNIDIQTGEIIWKSEYLIENANDLNSISKTLKLLEERIP